jgi:hypothetical protein
VKRPPIPRPSAAQLRALAILVDRGVDPLDGFYAATRGALVDYGWATSAAEGYRATEAGRTEHQLANPNGAES